MLVYSIYFKHLELIPGVSKSCSLGPVLVAAEIGEYIRVGFRSSCVFFKGVPSHPSDPKQPPG